MTYAEALSNPHSHFVMDGYDDEICTIKEEQNKRIKGNVARDIVFTGEMELSDYCKSEVLNKSHKTAFLNSSPQSLEARDMK